MFCGYGSELKNKLELELELENFAKVDILVNYRAFASRPTLLQVTLLYGC